jgi:Kdo2-lipid IVA lauroyltransferase/acyltransferase
MSDEQPKPRVKKKIHYSDRYRDHLAPAYIKVWLGLAGMAMLGRLPHQAALFTGRLLGYLMLLFARSRRHITQTNIRLCFPELDDNEQQRLVKATMLDNGMGMAEMCIAWFNYGSITDDMIEVVGEQHLIDAVAQDKGVILVGGHYTTLDLGGVLMAKVKKVGVMYRANKNPLFDLVMRQSRAKFCAEVIERSDMRAVIRFLKKGGVMWYAPDQDYGPKQSVFAPFFGIQAASITSIPRLVKINNSAVLMLGHHRKPDGKGYIVTISEPLENYPCGDDDKDAAVINMELEKRIRAYPEQYMWLHRRFKTRPIGESKVY